MSPIHPNNLDLVWGDVSPYIVNGVEYCRHKYSVNDIKELILNNTITLWIIYNVRGSIAGCILTLTMDYPQFKTLVVFLACADEMSLVTDCIPKLEQLGRQHNCRTMELYGRRGWAKVLERYGFEQAHLVMELRL